MSENPIAFVNDLLHTKWSKWTAGSTFLLSIASTKLPDALQTLGISLTPPAILPLRIIAPLAIYSLGMTVVLILEVIFFHSQRNLLNKQTKPNAMFSTHTGTWIDGNVHYCARCWQDHKYSPMQTQIHCWRCPSCDTYQENPDNPYP